jgi:hypothetical protein
MKRLITASCLAALALTASAQTPSSEPAKTTKSSKTAQQGKMAQCNAQAKADGKKGDERKAFMKQCLSKKPVTTASK